MLAVHGGHANLRAHGSLGYRYRNYAVQVVVFAREEGVLFHVQHYVQISGWAAKGADFARSGKANSRSVFDARGDLRVYGSLAQNAAFAFAFWARIGDDAACALAGGTGASDAEESLLIADLTVAVAGAASGGALPWRRTGAATVFAGLVAANRNLGLRAEERLLKLEGQVLAEIGAALNPVAAAATGATAEHVAEAEEFTEDVALSEANRNPDARAFAALMRRIREVDSNAHTVIMMQVENEVGVTPQGGDRS